jgi:hypothetical protein
MVIGEQGCPQILVIFVLDERKRFGDIVLIGRDGFYLRIYEFDKVTRT